MRIQVMLLVCAMGLGWVVNAGLVSGNVPDELRLEGKTGGRTDGTSWSSHEVRGKTYVLFYVDPDEKELNEHVGEAIKKEEFDGDLFGSIAVINMEATIIPNWLLSRMIASKQKKYPRTIYVYDKAKVLVDKWGLEDNSYDIVLFSHQGHVLFAKNGKLSAEETARLVELIKTDIGR